MRQCNKLDSRHQTRILIGVMRAPTTVRLLRLAQFPILRQLELEQARSLVPNTRSSCWMQCNMPRVCPKPLQLIVLSTGAAAGEQRQLASGK
jgi:hypothetical protein